MSKSAGNDVEASEPRVTFETNLFDNGKSRNLSLVFTFGLTFRKKQKGKKKVTKSFSVVQITALCPADLSRIYFLVLYLVLSEHV